MPGGDLTVGAFGVSMYGTPEWTDEQLSVYLKSNAGFVVEAFHTNEKFVQAIGGLRGHTLCAQEVANVVGGFTGDTPDEKGSTHAHWHVQTDRCRPSDDTSSRKESFGKDSQGT